MPVYLGHRQVNHKKLGPMAKQELEGVFPARSLADHFDVALGLQEGTQLRPTDRRIIQHANTDFAHLPLATSRPTISTRDSLRNSPLAT